MNNHLDFHNASFKLQINRQTGALEYFGTTSKNRLTAAAKTAFEISVLDCVGNRMIMPSNLFNPPEIKETEEQDSTVITMVFGGAQMIPGLTVTVTAKCPQHEAFSYWRIKVAGIRAGMLLECVDFPEVRFSHGELVGLGGKNRVFWPENEGCLLEDLNMREEKPWIKHRRIDFPNTGVTGYYPGACPMQFMAHYDDVGGIYFAAHDSGHGTKGVEIVPALPETFRLGYQVFCGEQHDGAFELSYDLVLGVFDGDWTAAADIYRNWLQKADHTMPPPLKNNPVVPEWLTDSPVVLMYAVRGDGDDKGELLPNEYYPYENAMPVVDRYAAAFDSRIMSLLMHWEGTAPWAPPYVWPPFGGAELLAKYRDKLHAKGHQLGVYCSGTAWTQTSSILDYSCEKQFKDEHLENEMCVGPRGEMYAAICNGPKGGGQRIGYDMCVKRDWVQKTVVDEIRKLLDADLDYIQFFDQNMGGTANICYAKNHGHPPVPGQWHTAGMMELLEKVQQLVNRSGKKPIIGCESAAAHPYIKNLLFNDLRFNLNFLLGRNVPAYAYVFHEYVNNFMGNQVCTYWFLNEKNGSPHNLLFRTAYSFNAGDILSVLLKDKGDIHWSWVAKWSEAPPDQKNMIDLIRNLNFWRRKDGKEYLCFGRMLKPLALENVGTYNIKLQEGRSIDYESILTSRWRSQDGKTAQFLTNYLPEAQKVTLKLDVPGNGAVVTMSNGSGQRVEFRNKEKIEIEVPPLSAVMVEFSA